MTLHQNSSVAVLSGFLDTGKTAFLNPVLNTREGGRAAVSVNDTREVNKTRNLPVRTAPACHGQKERRLRSRRPLDNASLHLKD